MATPARALRTQWLRSTSCIISRTTRTTLQTRANSTLSQIQNDLPKRLIPPTWDDLSPQNSYRLHVTLADHLPKSFPSPPSLLPPAISQRELPVGHHLVYFEQSRRGSEMLPDGTNPDQSPGAPWTRRMWAGGRVRYNNSLDAEKGLRLDGGRAVGCEFIRSVDVKGHEGEEKIFVRVERRLARANEREVSLLGEASEDESGSMKREVEHLVRQRLWRDGEEDLGECAVVETRNLVFLRERPPGEQEAAPAKKFLKPQYEPDYAHTVLPDSKLLFRFSALTFNAHAIHLDPAYSQNVEGHRDLLVHGPLSYTFLVTLLQHQLSQRGNEVIKNIEYRNLAPLYCGEEVRFCGKQTGDRKWEVWAQGPEGGVAVKGSVVTEAGRIDRADLR